MLFPTSHKTVFVLDHTLWQNCGVQFDLEGWSKQRSNTQPSINQISLPLLHVTKSIWSCAVEALTEYCRIVWDIFPSTKLVRFYAVDKSVHKLNEWNVEDQNLTSLMNAFIMLGPAKPDLKLNLESGFLASLNALTEPTPIQQSKRYSMIEGTPKILNRGRIVVITEIESEQDIVEIRNKFLELIMLVNKSATATDSRMPINHCDLVILNFTPEGHPFKFQNRIVPDYSPFLSYEFFNLGCGVTLAPKLCNLVLRHYDLASTTVTGIPMKEEQNASSSANYDVELFHPALAHTAILKGIPVETAHLRTVREGTDYETVTLKWCTPRSSASTELQQCSSAYRITSVDVNSRPSSCLTNFLLNGRWVMLEMPRRSGTKVISHMLACHGGDIYIHTMYTARSVLEDPPSISEGVGGRVPDYRIRQFAELVRNHHLTTHSSDNLEEGEHDGTNPLESSKSYLKRFTRVWPMTVSSSLLFNLDHSVNHFLKTLTKENLSENDVMECTNIIYDLLSLEARNDPLPVSNVNNQRFGGKTKKEEMFKVLWAELESFLKAYKDTENHQQILKAFLNILNKTEGNERNIEESNVDIDQALMEIESNNSREAEKRSADESSSDGTQSFSKKMKLYPGFGAVGQKSPLSLLQIWENRQKTREEEITKPLKGFIERDENNFTQLYKNFF